MIQDKIKVIIVDDHALIRDGLDRILSYEKDLEIVAQCSNGEEAFGAIICKKPDVVLLDINMPIMGGLETLKRIRENKLDVKVVMLTVENDRRTISESIDMGADGYILKESAGSEVVDAIRSVYGGEKFIDKALVTMFFTHIQNKKVSLDSPLNQLTERELKILYLISRGMKNREIGEKLYISEKTVKNNITNIFRKINVDDRVQATILAIKNDIDELISMN